MKLKKYKTPLLNIVSIVCFVLGIYIGHTVIKWQYHRDEPRIIIDCDTINIDSAYKPLQTNLRVRWREPIYEVQMSNREACTKHEVNEYMYGLVDQDGFAYRAKSIKVLHPDTIISGTDIFDTFTEIKEQ